MGAPAMTTRLFNCSERSRTTSRRYNEPMYPFLDASAWPSVARVREFWEGWFAEYEDDKKPALSARFASADNHNLLSAFLELFTFAVLKRTGYSVQIDVPVAARTPDFLASSGNGLRRHNSSRLTGSVLAGSSDVAQACVPLKDWREPRARPRTSHNRTCARSVTRPLHLTVSKQSVLRRTPQVPAGSWGLT